MLESDAAHTTPPSPSRHGTDTQHDECAITQRVRSCRLFLLGLQHAAIELVALDRFEQRLEIALAKAFVFLALADALFGAPAAQPETLIA